MARRPPIVRAYLGDEVVADNFAGGGGASLGIELALGRSPDLAVNHDPEAIAMHQANHPSTRHYVESVWQVDPRDACGGKPVALAWFSPDCKHHSKAKGGKPRDQKIRGLAWVAVTWAARVKPRVIALENVEEFRDWGPLHRTGPQAGKPIKARRGQTFRAFVRRLERLGYRVEHRLLRACDYGAPTTRRRLFLVARCDGQAIRWPAPTHGKGGEILGLQPYRTAAECIDWSITCPSIFDRDRPLADKTLARIARGVRKFVLETARPFIVKAKTHGGGGNDAMSADEPLRTVTASKRGEFAVVTPVLAPFVMSNNTNNVPKGMSDPVPTITTGSRNFLAVPYLVHRSNGERQPTDTAPGQAPRIYDVERPLGTVVAQGQKHALCTAFLAKHFGGGYSGPGVSLDQPVSTVTTVDHHGLVAAHLVKFQQNSTGQEPGEPLHTVMAGATRHGVVASHLIKLQGTSDAHVSASAHSIDEPMPTITAGGWKMAQVAAFLVRYNGQNTGQPVDEPAGALTGKPRFGLVTVTIDGEEYAIVDIGMRMLEPRELFRAQGFHDDYQIAPVGPAGKRLSKTAQIRMCGNSVSPPVAAAIVRANLGATDRRAA